MIEILAPAKINFTLEVLCIREDGYHEIRSLMEPVSLYDQLSFKLADGLRVITRNSKVAERDNLVYRAAKLLQQVSGAKKGAYITLNKIIPDSAGLGGGSSDAASTLIALNELWNLGLPIETLLKMGSSLGSDVPFFISGKPALLEGRGEIVRPIDAHTSTWIVLVCPDVKIPEQKTRTLYEMLGDSNYTDGSYSKKMLNYISKEKHLGDDLIFNVFESVAEKAFPELGIYKKNILDAGAKKVHMTGAGPALYAVCGAEREGMELAGKISGGGCQVYLVKTLN
ncbi:4-(cytidine 5'-diphospho)-2-C-methyl-D-erythritol kinase [Chloroflexota bacterium]